MKLIKAIMELFIAFFIVVTGVYILPLLPNQSKFVTFLYALSIVLSSVYFLLKANDIVQGSRENSK